MIPHDARTLALSTSSPLASVALIEAGVVVWEHVEEAPFRASGALATALAERKIDFGSIDFFAADVGPGSFSGVRVAVTMAKTLAWANGKLTLAADAFDLVDPDRTVVLPSRRGEWFLRRPGSAPERVTEWDDVPVVGYPLPVDERRPLAANFVRLLDRLEPIDPFALRPGYLIEPSISTPSKPFRSVAQ